MPKAIVAYETTYGSTREYAEELAARLGVASLSFKEAAAALNQDPTAPVIVLSPVHGPMHPGAKFVSDTDFGLHPVALCTVGMTLDEVAEKKDGAAKVIGSKASTVKRFYLPGRLNYSELSTAHRTTMWTIVNMLKAKPMKSANDKMMINTFDTDVDRVDFGRLDEIVAWAQG
ncbi:flavodoxin domain-containing protein [Corynebacterium callunae]|uniref:flavodoxin domain-containing protein n=1 Tax=Corynebacterium callunae TaxID=1721 RepID=UPI003981A634